jgi:hypothetical protein
MWIGGLMGAISGIVLLFSLGILLIFRLFTKWTKLALGFLLITGLTGGIICLVMGVKAGRDWASETEIEIRAKSMDAEQLTIIPGNGTATNSSKFKVRTTRNIGWFGVEGDYLSKYGIDIEYIKSPDSLFHITKLYRASGYSQKKARERSAHIKFRMDLRGDSLYMDSKYLFPKEDKLRGQEAGLLIEIPEGKSVQIDNRIIRLGDDYTGDNAEIHRENGRILSNGSYDHNDNH